MHTSLAAIGRATCIEADEPPSDVDDELSDDALLDGNYPGTHEAPNRYSCLTLEELNELTDESERKFLHLPRHQTVLNRSVTSLGMLHCRKNAEVGRLLCTLQASTQRLHIIDLQKTIAARLQEFHVLVREVERLVGQEAQLLAAFRAGDPPSSTSTRLSCIRAICENLRLCKNQLAVVRNSVQASRPLQALLRSHLKPLLQTFWNRHHHLEDRCLLLTHDLIYLGLQVISHSDLTKYTHNELWEISRGIEEFNAILESVKQQRRIRLLKRALVDYHQFTFSDFDALLLEIDLVKPISFSKILFRLASERAQRAVSGIHHFYFSDRDVLRHFKHPGSSIDRDFPRHTFELSILSPNENQSPQHPNKLTGNQSSRSANNAGDTSPTSDYFSTSNSTGMGSSGAKGDISRLVQRFLRLESPTGDYLRLEYDFASNFLDIISQSTQMLKELHNPTRRRLVKEETFETFVATLPPVVSNKPARKGVQWSDHKDVSVRHHVIGRYLDLIWREFDRQFELYMALHVHCSSTEAALGSLGSVSGLAPGARMALAELLRQTGTRDLFPPGVLPVLQKQADRLQREALVSLWDADMCRALGCSPGDNLSPTLLSGSLHCTRTGKAFLDALGSMMRLLCSSMEQVQGRNQSSRDETSESTSAAALTSHLNSITLALCLIGETARSCYRWHQGRVTNLLASWKPGQLQFVLHTDVRLILERLSACLHLMKRLQAVPSLLREERAMAGIRCELNCLSESHQQLQLLCSSSTKLIASKCQERAAEFFVEAMPGKSHWRNMKAPGRQTGGSSPSITGTVGLEAQDYARGALMFLLEPVLDAVRVLPPSSQITAATPAAAALCAAWQQHILKEKLKFNLPGALQLEADVNVLSEYLNAFVDSEEVRDSLLALSSVRELQAGVQVLKMQSTGRRSGQSNRADNDSRSTSCSSLPCSEVDTASAHELLDLDQFHFLPSLKEWLALRTCPEEGRKFLPLCR